MKLQILSDLHLDINYRQPYQLKDKDTFTIVCGDIAGSVEKTCAWLDANVKQGLFVAGNHMFYSEPTRTLQQITQAYEERYPLTNELSFLNDTAKIVNDVVFVGGTLWTDYRLFGESAAPMCKILAEQGMNDFRFGRVQQGKKIARLTADDCEKAFHASVATIDKVARRYPDKQVVVITHHAPSIRSVDEKYLLDPLTAAFASDLEAFIVSHPNIKLWCHGHVHTSKDYKIGQCRVVCNPLGYAQYGENSHFKSGFTVDISATPRVRTLTKHKTQGKEDTLDKQKE